MKMITVGMSQDIDSVQAGRQAARIAMGRMEKGNSVGWALAFCGGRHDGEAVLQGLRSEFGQVPIVGGTAIGTITNDLLGYTGYECAVAVFPASIPLPEIIPAYDLDAGEASVGAYLAGELRKTVTDENTVLLFYDSLRSGPPPVLNAGSRLVEGLYQRLGDKHPHLVGAGTIGDYQFSTSYVFDGKTCVRNGAVAVVLPPVIQSHTRIMHGCIPISSFLKITRLEGPIVYELDGKPALQVILNLFGEDKNSAMKDMVPLAMALGQKHGDRYAPYDESAYVNRLIMGANAEDGSLTLFESDFSVGTEIQIMSRDNEAALESVRERTGEFLASLGQNQPIFALYIDCAGRTCYFCGAEVEDASLVQQILGPNIPLLGFYSGVEIAPLLGQSRPLDWTGVLTVFGLKG